jgi:hypothetical protein
MSKLKRNSPALENSYDIIKSLVADSTDYCFHVKKCSDDGGQHLMLYLPEKARKDFDINQFRDDKYNLIGLKRVLIAFVSEGYVSDLNK